MHSHPEVSKTSLVIKFHREIHPGCRKGGLAVRNMCSWVDSGSISSTHMWLQPFLGVVHIKYRQRKHTHTHQIFFLKCKYG